VVATTCFLEGREVGRQRRRVKLVEEDVEAMILTVTLTKREPQYKGFSSNTVITTKI
jgi:hypothetical protein